MSEKRCKHGMFPWCADCIRDAVAEASGDAMASIYEKGWKAGEAAAKARLVEPPRWVPVSERLPEHCESVLVWRPGSSRPTIAWYDEEFRRWDSLGYTFSVADPPSHWMPLPTTPEG